MTHPAACIHTPVSVQQQLLKDLQGGGNMGSGALLLECSEHVVNLLNMLMMDLIRVTHLISRATTEGWILKTHTHFVSAFMPTL